MFGSENNRWTVLRVVTEWKPRDGKSRSQDRMDRDYRQWRDEIKVFASVGTSRMTKGRKN